MGSTLIIPDTTGKVALVRNLKAKDISWPIVQITEVEVRSVQNGHIIYRTRLQGDFSEPDPYSYVLSLGGSRPVSSPDVLYVPVYCVGGCNKSTPEVYAFKLPGFGMDYPRGELLGDPTVQPTKLNYVAMGDIDVVTLTVGAMT